MDISLPAASTAFVPADLQRQAAYFAHDALLGRLLNAVPDIILILILNAHRQVVYANDALLEKMRVRREEFGLGLRPGELFGCVHAAEAVEGCGATEFCRTCGAAQALIISLHGIKATKECRISTRDGSALDLQVTATPLEINGDAFTLFAVKDISSEKRRRVLERLFFHDLLNTAGVVIGLAEVLQDASPDEIELIRSRVFTLSLRLIDEINAYRELTEAENDELRVHPDLVDGRLLLRELRDQYAAHELAHERELVIAPSSESVKLYTDPTLLRRVIGNMIKNALEACKPGQTVTLRCALVEMAVEFSVHNPTYMPRTVQLQVFQRSFSTKGAGRGLGTYSMKLLSERYLAGSVDFVSTPEDGTTFFARYPLELPAT